MRRKPLRHEVEQAERALRSREISKAGKSIEEFIGLIDGIAFQTNLLALNASVEAAKAGEQGRGFAVVASEVRSLAQRSAGAAKDIKRLIDATVQQLEVGDRLVGEAGATMDSIVASVRQIEGIMADMAAASAEQSSGIDHINRAVAEMDRNTQQNAAMVEQAAAAADSLHEQAERMRAAYGLFRLAAGRSEGRVQRLHGGVRGDALRARRAAK